jgi:DNA repair protein RadC
LSTLPQKNDLDGYTVTHMEVPVSKATIRTSQAPRRQSGEQSPITDAGYLASIISTDRIPRRAVNTACDLIGTYGSLINVMSCPIEELAENPRIGPTGAARISSVNQLIAVSAFARIRNRPIIWNFDQLLVYLQWSAGHCTREELRMLTLDIHSHVQHNEVIAHGTNSGIAVDVPTIIMSAMRKSASAIILVHNHPSGDPEPSEADLTLTRSIEKACAMMGLRLADHLIVASGRWFSFAQAGLIQPAQITLASD